MAKDPASPPHAHAAGDSRVRALAVDCETIVNGAALGASRDAARSRVLLVDDDEDLANLLAKVLASRNYEVRTAHDGATALRLAREFAPDVALVDIGLPEIDGHELARELRKLLPDACKLIALTCFGEEGEREKSRAAGFAAHLLKPVSLATLRQAIER